MLGLLKVLFISFWAEITPVKEIRNSIDRSVFKKMKLLVFPENKVFRI